MEGDPNFIYGCACWRLPPASLEESVSMERFDYGGADQFSSFHHSVTDFLQRPAQITAIKQ